MIPAEECIGGRDLSEPRLRPDGAAIGYLMADDGTVSFVWHTIGPNGAAESAVGEAHVPHVSPMARIGRGLGGGAWAWTADGAAVVIGAVDGNLWVLDLATAVMRQITDHGPDRVAQAPAVSPGGRWVAYVVDQAEVWMVDLVGGTPARRLDDGTADFCFDPVFGRGRGTPEAPDEGCDVAWQAWNVPDMPWDGSRIERIHLDGRDAIPVIANGAAQQPRFAPDGQLACVRDDSGWATVWIEDRPLITEAVEHGGPSWGLGQRSFAFSADGAEVAFTRNEGGFGRLCVVTRSSGAVRTIGRGVHGQLSWVGDRIAALRTGARTPPEIVVYHLVADVERGELDCREQVPSRTLVERVGVATTIPEPSWRDQLIEPELVDLSARDAVVLHARLYRADPPSGDHPPRLICWLHGGPTDQWQVSYLPRIAHWRSRGWNILVPDHRGSTGHGRVYQQELRQRWGDLDVTDTIDALRHAQRAGLGTPETTVLIGGSAGGFTVLGVVRAAPGAVRAAVVVSPVSDLTDLAERSHRFERHSLLSLVGEPHTEAGAARYRRRSPAWFADQIRTPLLVLHGADDPVVPVQQSRVLAARIRTAGGTVELCVYPGEGHGFRQRAHQLDEYRRIEAFLHRHVP